MSNIKTWQRPVRLVGRCLLASLFILGGISKISKYDATSALMSDAGLEPVALLLPAAIALEIVGGTLLAIGRKGTVAAAIALTLFTLSTNLFFHDFWQIEDPQRALQLSLFLKNCAIAGALLFLAATMGDVAKHQRPASTGVE